MGTEARGAHEPEKDFINIFVLANSENKAYEGYEEVERRLMRYRELEPEEVYILTTEKSAFYTNYSDVKDDPLGLASSLTDTFREGVERIVGAKGYSEERHGGMRKDLFQGFLMQLQLCLTYREQQFEARRQAEVRPLRRLQRFLTHK